MTQYFFVAIFLSLVDIMALIKLKTGLLVLCCLLSFVVHTLSQDSKAEMPGRQIKSRNVNQEFNLKYEKLMKAAMLDSVIHLKTKQEFEDLVVNPTRNFSLVLFCRPIVCDTCKQILNNLRSIARSYVKQDPKDVKIFFIYVNHLLVGNIAEPVLFFVRPGEGLVDSAGLVSEYSEESIQRWLRSVIPEEAQPEDSAYINWNLCFYALFTIYFICKYRTRLIQMYESDLRKTISVSVIGLILCFTSGQVINHIEGVPFTIQAAGGRSFWIYPSTRMQLVLESLIVFGLSAGSVFGFIVLLEYGPKRKGHSSPILIVFGLLLFMSTFFVIVFIGQLKMR